MYELRWILKWEYVILDDVDEEWTYIPNLIRNQPGSSSSKEDLKKKVLEILDLDDESMASASATQPEDEVDPFANEDMLDHFYHSDLYGGPQ
ncbi:hypothetical protein ACE6H2_015395 [Prunus campanulata]